MGRLVPVLNRNNGSTSYAIPDLHIQREWAAGETKNIDVDELQRLQWIPGGAVMLERYLVIQDKEAIEQLNMKVEPEYFYTEEDIRTMLLTGSLDQVKDFLDFAPAGAIDIAKQIAVDERIPDSYKREAISEATGFNIDNAIYVNKVMEQEDEAKKASEEKTRRVNAEAPVEPEVVQPTRRTAAPPKKYNVVSKK